LYAYTKLKVGTSVHASNVMEIRQTGRIYSRADRLLRSRALALTSWVGFIPGRILQRKRGSCHQHSSLSAGRCLLGV